MQAAAKIGGEKIARNVDEAGNETFVFVAADEQGDSRTFMKVHDPQAGQEHVLFRGLEQLVAGKGLENVEQRLAVVAGRRHAGAFENLQHLASQKGNFAGTAVIGRRGEKTDEQVLADRLAFRIKALDSYGVHMYRAVDGRALVCLGDH